MHAAPWKFAFFCDGRAGSTDENGSTNGVHVATVKLLAAEAAREGVSLVIFPGDLINGGAAFGPLATQYATWKEAMSPLYDAHISVYPCRGNHETHQDSPRGASVQAWRAAFPDLPANGPAEQVGLTYKVEFSNACFIACDQFIGQTNYAQHTDTVAAGKYDSSNGGMIAPWVIQQVKSSKAQWVFAFGHESAFIGHHLDCLANVPAERDALWDALGARNGHGIYLSGHDHLYCRHVAPDVAGHMVMELVSGDSGAPRYPYDHAPLNASLDRRVVPKELYLNAGGEESENTGGHPMYFGLVVITVSDATLEGEWRALTNYDTGHYPPVTPAQPAFQTLDRFTWP
jgi:hypothetical protein